MPTRCFAVQAIMGSRSGSTTRDVAPLCLRHGTPLSMSGRSRVVRRRSGLMSMKAPPDLRLDGTNVELGRDIIRNCGLNLIAADDPSGAAVKAVKEGRGWDRNQETDTKGAIECGQS
jgi:hypothetical protein